MAGFTRFVALGDSQTEGLWDGNDRTGVAGWADRFAQRLAQDNPDLRYANLAVRGRRIGEVRDEQLDAALEMRPDLVGLCVGMNDVTRIGGELDEALDVMEEMYSRLTSSGATVMTTIFPDVRRIIPFATLLGPRVDQVNDRIRICADKYDLRLVDLFTAPSMTDLRLWSPDRLHANSLGHERFAQAAAEAVGLSGSDHSWADALPDDPAAPKFGNLRDEIVWAGAFLGPWAWRRLRGTSTGTGRVAKRPVLLPVSATQHSIEREH